MRILHVEQPPLDTPKVLSEWLTRLTSSMQGSIVSVYEFPLEVKMPTYAPDGLVVIFKVKILPYITHAGAWLRLEKKWVPMTQKII